jgi:hypothetical protein
LLTIIKLLKVVALLNRTGSPPLHRRSVRFMRTAPRIKPQRKPALRAVNSNSRPS